MAADQEHSGGHLIVNDSTDDTEERYQEEKEMKKKFKMVDLDCANCAAKMEDAIKKIDGVNDATVSFMMQKLTIDADDVRFDEIMQEVVAVCKKVEPDCQIQL